MQYLATITIMPHKELLDPQGKTVKNNLPNIGVTDVSDVRIGKLIRLTFEASNEAEAKAKVEQACSKLLANVIMEAYSYEITAA
jgi:phosphoribosylformylglycinamidine synthase subunit PurS